MDKRFKMKMGKRWIVVTLAIVAVAGLSRWWLLGGTKPAPGIPDSISRVQAYVAFPLYYPSPLPTGFRFNASSLTADKDAVIFALDYAEGMIVITQQARPSLLEETSTEKEVATSIGKAYIANLGGRKSGMVTTPGNLILISAQTPSTEVSREIETVIRSLQPIR